jgi:hypothetical protein
MHASHLLALSEPDEGQRKGRTSVRDAIQHSLLGALRSHGFQILSLLPSEEEHQVPV